MVEEKTPRFNFVQFMMLRAMVGYCSSANNQPTTDLIPNFADNIDVVKEKTNAITAILGAGKQNITGTALSKSDLKEILADTMMQVCGPVASFAKSSDNNPLLMAVKTSRSRLTALRAELLLAGAADLIGVVTPHLASLTNYNVNAASLTAVTTAATQFDNAIASPRIKIVERSGKLKEIGIMLFDCMQITRTQLDPLAVGFEKLGKKNFLNGYIKSRKLTPFGNHHTRASITVTMGDTGAPIANATIQVENTLLSGSTDGKGHLTITRVPAGMQNLIVTAPGFPNPVTSGPHKFTKGKSTHITVNFTEFDIPSVQSAPASQSQVA